MIDAGLQPLLTMMVGAPSWRMLLFALTRRVRRDGVPDSECRIYRARLTKCGPIAQFGAATL
jgi:hypothetical protein